MPTTAKLSISFINNGISSYYVILFDSFSLFMIKLPFTTARDTRYTFIIKTKSFIVGIF